ncbi:hypothetical protein Ptr902_03860 [Pyrenophora tritici-repentis]|nr:hypothetical protein Ptr902_03860 [Pyrenophora tritici-repentis]
MPVQELSEVMDLFTDDGTNRPHSRNYTFPFDPMPRQVPRTGGPPAELLYQGAPPPHAERPDTQREHINVAPPNHRSHAAEAAIANANRPTAGTSEQKQRELQQQLPTLQTTLPMTADTPSYEFPRGGLQTLNTYNPHFLFAPVPALSAGDRTPTAQSPQTPTARMLQTSNSGSPQIPPLTLDTGDKMLMGEPLQIRDDIDSCSSASSTSSEVYPWNYDRPR